MIFFCQSYKSINESFFFLIIIILMIYFIDILYCFDIHILTYIYKFNQWLLDYRRDNRFLIILSNYIII